MQNQSQEKYSSILDSLLEAQRALDQLISSEASLKMISSASALLVRTLAQKGRLFSCGNGGSMCDAMHFAEELTGRFRKDRRAFPALAISDPGHLSCVGNDFGY